MMRYKFLARMLWRSLYSAIAGWWEWVSCDLDEYYCCDGTPKGSAAAAASPTAKQSNCRPSITHKEPS